jgi:hypothetical protein
MAMRAAYAVEHLYIELALYRDGWRYPKSLELIFGIGGHAIAIPASLHIGYYFHPTDS